MANAKTIGLLCAGTTKYHPIQSGRSNSVLSRSELAGLLAGLSNQHMNLALASYMCDLDSERKLIAHVRVWLAGLAIKEQWFKDEYRIKRGIPWICNMAAIAVFEVVRPNNCKHCKGNETINGRLCIKCHGSGFAKLSARKIAEAIGMDHRNYDRNWCGRYEKVFRYVQNIDSDIKRHMRCQDAEEQYHMCYA